MERRMLGLDVYLYLASWATTFSPFIYTVSAQGKELSEERNPFPSLPSDTEYENLTHYRLIES